MNRGVQSEDFDIRETGIEDGIENAVDKVSRQLCSRRLDWTNRKAQMSQIKEHAWELIWSALRVKCWREYLWRFLGIMAMSVQWIDTHR
jgi:hypothetical protein